MQTAEEVIDEELVNEFCGYQPPVPEPLKDEQKPKLTNHQAKFLEEIKVEVGVEVGQLSMSAAQMIDLSAGQSFDFRCSADHLITLKAGGESIGVARFIELGEELALEIVSIGNSPENCKGNESKQMVDKTYEQQSQKSEETL